MLNIGLQQIYENQRRQAALMQGQRDTQIGLGGLASLLGQQASQGSLRSGAGETVKIKIKPESLRAELQEEIDSWLDGIN